MTQPFLRSHLPAMPLPPNGARPEPFFASADYGILPVFYCEALWRGLRFAYAPALPSDPTTLRAELDVTYADVDRPERDVRRVCPGVRAATPARFVLSEDVVVRGATGGCDVAREFGVCASVRAQTPPS